MTRAAFKEPHGWLGIALEARALAEAWVSAWLSSRGVREETSWKEICSGFHEPPFCCALVDAARTQNSGVCLWGYRKTPGPADRNLDLLY